MVSPILAAGGKEFRVEAVVANDRKTLRCSVSIISNPSFAKPIKWRISLLNQKGKPNVEFEPPLGFDYYGTAVCNETLSLDPNQLLNPELGVCVDDKIIVKVDLEFHVESTTNSFREAPCATSLRFCTPAVAPCMTKRHPGGMIKRESCCNLHISTMSVPCRRTAK
jgi:hypothetical protein